jgi:hypothetical protein
MGVVQKIFPRRESPEFLEDPNNPVEMGKISYFDEIEMKK